MGKCSRCGKRIEYNAFVIIDDKVYCPACVIEKAKEAKVIVAEEIETMNKAEAEEVVKATKEAEEQFEKDMASVTDEIAEDKELNQKMTEEKKPKKKRSKKKPVVPEFYGGGDTE